MTHYVSAYSPLGLLYYLLFSWKEPPKLLTFQDLFADDYDHPVNETVEKVLLEWDSDD